MANVSSTSGASGTDYLSSLTGTKAKSTGTGNTADEIQDRFLLMLTTQLKNQDPLSPLDNSQMTSQLAQINTISGIEKTNATLAQLLDIYNNGQGVQAAGLIGKYVMVGGNSITLAGGQSAGGVQLKEAADQVTVSIVDGDGRVVQTQSLGPHEAGNLAFTWDGKKADGSDVPDGEYRFSVVATRGNTPVEASAMQLGMVNAVSRNNGSFQLDLGKIGLFNMNDVQQII